LLLRFFGRLTLQYKPIVSHLGTKPASPSIPETTLLAGIFASRALEEGQIFLSNPSARIMKLNQSVPYFHQGFTAYHPRKRHDAFDTFSLSNSFSHTEWKASALTYILDDGRLSDDNSELRAPGI